VRTQFAPSSRTAWTGWTTFRSVFPIEPHLSHIAELPDEALYIWGPDRTLFVSRLGRGLSTVVGSSQSDPQEEATTTTAAPDGSVAPPVPWDSDGDVALLRGYYRDWSPLVRSIVDATPHTRVYPNKTAHALDSWVLGGGRVTLAGDAAHAHGGAFAAGRRLALDDAWAFAAALSYVFPAAALQGGPSSSPSSDTDRFAAQRGELGEGIARALRLYERTRKAHTDHVMRVVAQGNAKRVGRCRTATVERDEQLRERMKGRPNITWIHEHDVMAAFANAVDFEGGQAVRGEQASL
jgi:salicylate hydroxylase